MQWAEYLLLIPRYLVVVAAVSIAVIDNDIVIVVTIVFWDSCS